MYVGAYKQCGHTNKLNECKMLSGLDFLGIRIHTYVCTYKQSKFYATKGTCVCVVCMYMCTETCVHTYICMFTTFSDSSRTVLNT